MYTVIILIKGSLPLFSQFQVIHETFLAVPGIDLTHADLVGALGVLRGEGSIADLLGWGALDEVQRALDLLGGAFEGEGG